MSGIETIFRRSLAATRAQVTALARASTGEAARWRAFGTILLTPIERLDRASAALREEAS
jgi:hypothetical protein